MKGLELAKRLYEERARKLFENELPDLIPQMAVGLVGEGSECFGFDDEISRDHDWGPAFCIWLPQEVLAANSGRLDSVLAELPRQFEGFEVRMTDPRLRMGRVGPLPLELFYQRFLNVPRAPENLMEWRRNSTWLLPPTVKSFRIILERSVPSGKSCWPFIPRTCALRKSQPG